MLTTDHFITKSKDEIDDEQIEKIKALLIEGFREKDCLFAISLYVTQMVEEAHQGKWLCLITPSQIELGLTFVSNNYLKLEFEHNSI